MFDKSKLSCKHRIDTFHLNCINRKDIVMQRQLHATQTCLRQLQSPALFPLCQLHQIVQMRHHQLFHQRRKVQQHPQLLKLSTWSL